MVSGFARAGRSDPSARDVFVVAIAHDDGNRRTERFTAAHAGQKFDFVALDFHARAATVAALAPRQRLVDAFDVDAKMRGQPVEDTDERRPVRLARS